MKTPTILLAMSLCACSSMHKETYTETRNFHYPKGTTPHLKEMYMHKPQVTETQVRQAEPVIHQEFNHNPDPVDFDYVGDMPQQEKTLDEINNENNILYAMMLNKMLKGNQ
jgi:hypothetical protein